MHINKLLQISKSSRVTCLD